MSPGLYRELDVESVDNVDIKPSTHQRTNHDHHKYEVSQDPSMPSLWRTAVSPEWSQKSILVPSMLSFYLRHGWSTDLRHANARAGWGHEDDNRHDHPADNGSSDKFGAGMWPMGDSKICVQVFCDHSNPNDKGKTMINLTENRLLLSILAAQDAVWEPNRDWKRPRPANVHAARREFHTNGVRFIVGGQDNDRKQANRILHALADAGQVFLTGSTKALAVRLSDEAEDRARAFIELPRLGDSLPIIRRLERLTKMIQVEPNRDGWVNEADLGNCGSAGCQRHYEIMEILLPVLSRGLVESRSSIRGNVAYRRTSKPLPKIEKPTKLPDDGTDEDNSWYIQEMNRQYAIITDRKPEKANVVHVPLSCGNCIFAPAKDAGKDDMDDDSED